MASTQDDTFSKEGDDMSSCVCESDDGGKFDSANEDFLSAEDDERVTTPDDCRLSVSSCDSSESKMTSATNTSVTDLGSRSSGSSDALESAVRLANGIRILSTNQEENWRRINDLINKKDMLIKEMTELVKNVKTKMSSSTLSVRDSDSSSFCVSCSKPLCNKFHDSLYDVRSSDALWTKHPIDFIEELFHVENDWKYVNDIYDNETDVNSEWNLDEEDEKESTEDLINFDFSQISVPEGFENSPRQETTDIL